MSDEQTDRQLAKWKCNRLLETSFVKCHKKKQNNKVTHKYIVEKLARGWPPIQNLCNQQKPIAAWNYVLKSNKNVT